MTVMSVMTLATATQTPDLILSSVSLLGVPSALKKPVFWSQGTRPRKVRSVAALAVWGVARLVVKEAARMTAQTTRSFLNMFFMLILPI